MAGPTSLYLPGSAPAGLVLPPGVSPGGGGAATGSKAARQQAKGHAAPRDGAADRGAVRPNSGGVRSAASLAAGTKAALGAAASFGIGGGGGAPPTVETVAGVVALSPGSFASDVVQALSGHGGGEGGPAADGNNPTADSPAPEPDDCECCECVCECNGPEGNRAFCSTGFSPGSQAIAAGLAAGTPASGGGTIASTGTGPVASSPGIGGVAGGSATSALDGTAAAQLRGAAAPGALLVAAAAGQALPGAASTGVTNRFSGTDQGGGDGSIQGIVVNPLEVPLSPPLEVPLSPPLEEPPPDPGSPSSAPGGPPQGGGVGGPAPGGGAPASDPLAGNLGTTPVEPKKKTRVQERRERQKLRRQDRKNAREINRASRKLRSGKDRTEEERVADNTGGGGKGKEAAGGVSSLLSGGPKGLPTGPNRAGPDGPLAAVGPADAKVDAGPNQKSAAEPPSYAVPGSASSGEELAGLEWVVASAYALARGRFRVIGDLEEDTGVVADGGVADVLHRDLPLPGRAVRPAGPYGTGMWGDAAVPSPPDLGLHAPETTGDVPHQGPAPSIAPPPRWLGTPRMARALSSNLAPASPLRYQDFAGLPGEGVRSRLPRAPGGAAASPPDAPARASSRPSGRVPAGLAADRRQDRWATGSALRDQIARGATPSIEAAMGRAVPGMATLESILGPQLGSKFSLGGGSDLAGRVQQLRDRIDVPSDSDSAPDASGSGAPASDVDMQRDLGGGPGLLDRVRGDAAAAQGRLGRGRGSAISSFLARGETFGASSADASESADTSAARGEYERDLFAALGSEQATDRIGEEHARRVEHRAREDRRFEKHLDKWASHAARDAMGKGAAKVANALSLLGVRPAAALGHALTTAGKASDAVSVSHALIEVAGIAYANDPQKYMKVARGLVSEAAAAAKEANGALDKAASELGKAIDKASRVMTSSSDKGLADNLLLSMAKENVTEAEVTLADAERLDAEAEELARSGDIEGAVKKQKQAEELRKRVAELLATAKDRYDQAEGWARERAQQNGKLSLSASMVAGVGMMYVGGAAAGAAARPKCKPGDPCEGKCPKSCQGDCTCRWRKKGEKPEKGGGEETKGGDPQKKDDENGGASGGGGGPGGGGGGLSPSGGIGPAPGGVIAPPDTGVADEGGESGQEPRKDPPEDGSSSDPAPERPTPQAADGPGPEPDASKKARVVWLAAANYIRLWAALHRGLPADPADRALLYAFVVEACSDLYDAQAGIRSYQDLIRARDAAGSRPADPGSELSFESQIDGLRTQIARTEAALALVLAGPGAVSDAGRALLGLDIRRGSDVHPAGARTLKPGQRPGYITLAWPPNMARAVAIFVPGMSDTTRGALLDAIDRSEGEFERRAAEHPYLSALPMAHVEISETFWRGIADPFEAASRKGSPMGWVRALVQSTVSVVAASFAPLATVSRLKAESETRGDEVNSLAKWMNAPNVPFEAWSEHVVGYFDGLASALREQHSVFEAEVTEFGAILAELAPVVALAGAPRAGRALLARAPRGVRPVVLSAGLEAGIWGADLGEPSANLSGRVRTLIRRGPTGLRDETLLPINLDERFGYLTNRGGLLVFEPGANAKTLNPFHRAVLEALREAFVDREGHFRADTPLYDASAIPEWRRPAQGFVEPGDLADALRHLWRESKSANDEVGVRVGGTGLGLYTDVDIMSAAYPDWFAAEVKEGAKGKRTSLGEGLSKRLRKYERLLDAEPVGISNDFGGAPARRMHRAGRFGTSSPAELIRYLRKRSWFPPSSW